MSKKANLITLRNVPRDLTLSENNSKQIIKYLNFLKVFIYFLQKKGIWALQSTLHTGTSFCKLYFNIFFTTKVSKTYKKRLQTLIQKNSTSGALNAETNPSVDNFLKSIKPQYVKLTALLDLFIKHNLYFFSFKNLNTKLNKADLLYLHKRLNKFKNVLFKRRNNLYFDCLKIASLLYRKLISVSYFLFVLSNIFKHLSKKLHGRFLTFLGVLIHCLVKSIYDGKDVNSQDCEGTLKGIKFKINGKLKGKMRAGTHLIRYGQIPNQSIDIPIEYAMLHTFTRYGVFGMQVWLHK